MLLQMPIISLFFLVITALFLPVRAQEYPGTPADRLNYQKKINTISASAKAQRNDLKRLMLGGNVTTQQVKSGEIRYNRDGSVKEISTFDDQGYRQTIRVFKYDTALFLQSETEFTHWGELVGKTLYKYNSDGFMVEKTIFNSFDYVVSKTVFEPDRKKNTYTMRIMYSPDSVSLKEIRFYSDLIKGFVKEVWRYSGENTLDFKKEIRKGKNGRIDSEVFINANDRQMYFLKYHYDQSGNPVLIEKHFPSGVIIKHTEYNYTPAGLLTGEIKYNDNGEIISFHKFTYE